MGQFIRSTVALVGVAMALAACGGGGGSSSSPPPNPMYVRASGSDGNSGADPGHALRSISRAAVQALDGYTIIVGPGNYAESVEFSSTGAAPKGVQFVADPTGVQTGDAPNPVVIDASNSSGKAGFKFSGAAAQVTTGGGQRPTLVDGFEILGGADGGIVLKTHSDQFTIQNCIVHDNPGDAIRVQDSDAVVVFNNLIYNNGSCDQTGACSGDGVALVGTVSGSQNGSVYNNTIYGNKGHGVTVGTTKVASQGATVLNNIVQGNALNIKVISGHPTASNDSLHNYAGNCNLVFLPTYDPNTIRGGKDLGVDAMFVSAPGDFHLLSGSGAIDRSDPSACALLLPNAQASILRQRTTTGSNASPGPPDSGNIDLGYHYPRH